jgi:hypothetical protein
VVAEMVKSDLELLQLAKKQSSLSVYIIWHIWEEGDPKENLLSQQWWL